MDLYTLGQILPWPAPHGGRALDEGAHACRFPNLVGVPPTQPQPLLRSFAPTMLLPQGSLLMSSVMSLSHCKFVPTLWRLVLFPASLPPGHMWDTHMTLVVPGHVISWCPFPDCYLFALFSLICVAFLQGGW